MVIKGNFIPFINILSNSYNQEIFDIYNIVNDTLRVELKDNMYTSKFIYIDPNDSKELIYNTSDILLIDNIKLPGFHYIKNGKNFGGKISFIITGDEEGEAINGTPQIMEWIKKQNIKIDHCLVGEPTSNAKIGDKVKIGRRGSVNFFLTVKGVQGHTANGHRAQNPVHYLTKLITNILEKPLDEGNEFFLPTAIQIPTFDVGNPAHNVIPEYASATINIRFNDLHTPESLIQWLNEKIESIFTNMDNVSCKVKHEISARSFLNKPGNLSKIVSKSISQATGRNEEPELATDGGTSDARFIKNYCEVIELGIRNQTLHQVDEFVFLDDLTELTKIYYKILENYFSKN